jgi:hypothetical protein
MGPLTGLISELLAIAIQAFSFFIAMVLSILEFFVVLFQAILNAFHG